MAGRGRGRPGGGGGGGGRGRGDMARGGAFGGFGRGTGRGAGSNDRTDTGPIIFTPLRSTGTLAPSSAVTDVEDKIVKAQASDINLANFSIKEKESVTEPNISLQIRPNYATLGTNIVLRTNYFHFQPIPKSVTSLYRYNVEITPEQTVRRKLNRIFQLAWLTTYFLPFADRVASDGSSIIISAVELPMSIIADERKTKLEIVYYDVDQAGPTQNSPVYTMIITPGRAVHIGDLSSYLNNTGPAASLDSKEEILQALNIVMSKKATLDAGVVPHGQNKHFRVVNNPAQLGGGLVALTGYYSSIRTSNARILLNLNVCTSAFYEPIPLHRFMADFLGGFNPPNDESWPRSKLFQLRSFLKGVRVQTRHSGGPKIRTIGGLGTPSDPGMSPSNLKFETDDKRMWSVKDWFRKQYDSSLEYGNRYLPAVDLGRPGKPAYTPPELCEIIGGQPFKGKLNEKQTSKMITIACQPPAVNARLITGDGCDVIGISDDTQARWLARFGFSVDPAMLTVRGRILQAPNVVYMPGKEQGGRAGVKSKGPVPFAPQGGSWNMNKRVFIKGASIASWASLRIRDSTFCIASDQDVKNATDRFIVKLREYGVSIGRQLASKPDIILRSVKEADIVRDITAGMEAWSREHGDYRPKVLFVLLPSTNKTVYATVKYIGDILEGIHTVCVVTPKFANPKAKNPDTFYANVALKFNLKFGGVNHTIPPNALGTHIRSGAMVVGIDVTHPSPGSVKGAPSIAGVVASIDNQFAQWPASIILQDGKKEMVTHLEEMMIERLELWARHNSGALPVRIIIYRDGVGESQYQTVLVEELPPIRRAIGKVYKKFKCNTRPKLAILIVGKRHHTRFYPVHPEQADANGNPKNGTIVDRGITGNRYWDFYLQAHTGLKGTARSAHYVIVLDEIGLGADGAEAMTHNLCYLFGRATKAVSVCPPAYYADLLCERGRSYIHSLLNDGNDTSSVSSGEETLKKANERWGNGIHPKLKDSMFYI